MKWEKVSNCLFLVALVWLGACSKSDGAPTDVIATDTAQEGAEAQQPTQLCESEPVTVPEACSACHDAPPTESIGFSSGLCLHGGEYCRGGSVRQASSRKGNGIKV